LGRADRDCRGVGDVGVAAGGVGPDGGLDGLPHRQVVRARALLWAGEGVANEEIARRSGVDSDPVRRWRKRFAGKGPAGVGVIAKGRGRGSWLPPGTVGEVLRLTRTELPADGSTHWTTRSLAARVGIGKDAVARITRLMIPMR